jgi:hypothetical protein
MQIKLLDVDAINEMPSGDPVWVVADEETNKAIAHQQGDTGEFIVVTFLKEEDARHFTRILKQIEPHRYFATQAKQIRALFDAVRANGENVGLLSPNDAREFFKENYPGLEADYYE